MATFLNDFLAADEFLKSPAQFLSFMSLTIEAANLDFALFYKQVFENVGDLKSANIMDVVLTDEIRHVGLGYSWLSRWKGDRDLGLLSGTFTRNLTPARAKGNIFNEEGRRKAGMDDDFIKTKNFRSDFWSQIESLGKIMLFDYGCK